MNFFQRIRTNRTLKKAAQLQADGNLQAAVDCLTLANRKHASTRLERALVDCLLQIDLTDQPFVPTQKVADATPAALRNFRSGDIPEIPADQLSPAVLREAIAQSGYLIVRGLFDAGEAEAMKAYIDESLNARVDLAGSDNPPENPWYYPSPHFPGDHVAYSKRGSKKKFDRTGSFKVIDSPRGSFRILELYRKHNLKSLIQGYFGEVPLLATRKWVFRLVAPIPGMDDSIGGGWHQDGQFMGDDVNALNMWVALSPCGDGTPSPGITLLPRRIEEIVEFGTRGARLDWVVGGDLVEELSADCGIVSPYFGAGDALFFDHFSLHRSGHGPDQTENRYALESWFYARSGHSGNFVIPYF